ncbi:hypothetical protein OSC52_15380 [Clostridium pasteurianum]|uniref:hypothetical protein n=1 Tax=Clostridium pasteurianum TaxID=1501 RepID=UPI002260923E|nr:hypothetical protein [Clostridium pasteurianum]UZW13218.1 hypothetical protein OSC52_15380 [Clostridium pasteurianum]
MKRDEIKRELSKYPKEILIKVFMNIGFFDSDRLLQDVKWEAANLRMDTLMAKDKEIRKEIATVIDKQDIKSNLKYLELMEQSMKIDKKIMSVMREQDKLLGIVRGS